MKKLVLIWLGKIIALASQILNLGAGSTWPGHVALWLEPQVFPLLLNQVKKGIIFIAGTNGKTTTAKMVRTILESSNIIHNESGANLLNGMVSAVIQKSDWLGKIRADWAIFEVDEATLPLALAEVTPKVVVLLNLFRDQLDRYGEVDAIAEKWREALVKLPKETAIILDADDSHIALLGKNLTAKVSYFGLSDPKLFLEKIEHAADSVYCPNCGQKLDFIGVYFSHLGHWSCSGCGQKRPRLDLSSWDYSLPGVYNYYNTLAAVLVAKVVGVKERDIRKRLADFQPAFGRQEEFELEGKKIRLFLSKNPAGFNESLRTIKDFPGRKKVILLLLNDRIPDGRDVSWIWDVDFEMILEGTKIIVSGDRAYDMGLRIKYAFQMKNEKLKMKNDNVKLKIFENLKEAVFSGLKEISAGETLYILPTYSAMLEIRKILGGRKIL